MNIGAAIENVRKVKDISQKELAVRAKIAQSYLSLIENNKKEPNIKVLKEISSSLDIPLPFLFLYSVTEDDVPAHKQELFQVVMPLVKTLLNQYANPIK